MSVEQITSNIKIRVKNKSFAKFGIIPVEEVDFLSTIDIFNNDNLNSNLKVRNKNSNDLNSSINLFNTNNIESNIKIVSSDKNDIKSNIFIKPKNKSYGKLEVIQPLILTNISSSTADSFVRSNIPRLNYGIEQSMIVGYSNSLKEIFRSFLSFNIDSSLRDYHIDKVYLNIKNTNFNDKKQILNLYDLENNFDEYGVTWRNKQESDIIINEFIVEPEPNVNKIDITDFVVAKLNNGISNLNFLIKSKDESLDSITQFSTKESSYQPNLEIKYFDKTVQSLGHLNISSTLTVSILTFKEINSNLFINSYWNSKDFSSTVYVTKPEIESTIQVRKNDSNNLYSNIITRQKMINEFETDINVSNPNIFSNLYVLEKNYFNSNLIVRHTTKKDIIADLIISRDSILSSIKLILSNNLMSSLIVRNNGNKDFISSTNISRDFIYSSLKIKPYENLISNIIIKTNDINELKSVMNISRNSLESNIKVTIYNDLLSSVRIRNNSFDNLISSINISRDFINSNIYIKHNNKIDSNIIVQRKENININSTIVVSREKLQSSIIVKVIDNEDIYSKLSISVPDIESNIIIRTYDFNDLFSDIKVRLLDVNDIDSTIKVYYIDSILSNISIANFEKEDLKSNINIFKNSNIFSNISVFKNDSLLSNLTISKNDFNNIMSNLKVNVKMIYDLESYINVVYNNEVICNMIVVSKQSIGYVFIM